MNREQTILKYKKYAENVAYKYFLNSNIPSNLKDDIISFGYIGLIDAIDRYDDSKECNILTWIRNKIIFNIKTELRKIDFFPRTFRAKIKLINEIEREYTNNNECKSIPYEILTNQLKEKYINSNGNKCIDIEKIMDSVIHYTTNDFNIFCEYNDRTYEKIFDIEEKVIQKDLLKQLELSFSFLKDREQYSIIRYYIDEIPMSQIGIELNVTESRISQIIQNAVLKLRKLFFNDKKRKQIMEQTEKETLLADLNKLEQKVRKCKCGAILAKDRKVGVCPECWGKQINRKNKKYINEITKPLQKNNNENIVSIDFSNDKELLKTLNEFATKQRRTIENQILFMLDQKDIYYKFKD